MFVIKKEEITKDIIINVDNNMFLGNYEEEPIVSFIDGELKITLNNKIKITVQSIEETPLKPLEK